MVLSCGAGRGKSSCTRGVRVNNGGVGLLEVLLVPDVLEDLPWRPGWDEEFETDC